MAVDRREVRDRTRRSRCGLPHWRSAGGKASSGPHECRFGGLAAVGIGEFGVGGCEVFCFYDRLRAAPEEVGPVRASCSGYLVQPIYEFVIQLNEYFATCHGPYDTPYGPWAMRHELFGADGHLPGAHP